MDLLYFPQDSVFQTVYDFSHGLDKVGVKNRVKRPIYFNDPWVWIRSIGYVLAIMRKIAFKTSNCKLTGFFPRYKVRGYGPWKDKKLN